MPKRIQRLRKKGWRKPPGSVVVTRPHKWGNPWRVGQVIDGVEIDAAEAVDLYREYLRAAWTHKFGREALDLSELRGKDLVCYCPLDQPCHADILLELANA